LLQRGIISLIENLSELISPLRSWHVFLLITLLFNIQLCISHINWILPTSAKVTFYRFHELDNKLYMVHPYKFLELCRTFLSCTTNFYGLHSVTCTPQCTQKVNLGILYYFDQQSLILSQIPTWHSKHLIRHWM